LWIPAIKGALSTLGICGPYVAAPNATWEDSVLAPQRECILQAQRDGLFEPGQPGDPGHSDKGDGE